ncbi:MAG: ABC transporter permease [Gemmatimonadetes bacterium]|nr:ABC transporter permease [Gemmatimonadota bacterium]
MSQLKFALRSLTKTPFVTAVAVLSLGLGIGANAAIFSLFDQILLMPLPVEAPEQLVNLGAPGPHPGSTSCSQAGSCQEIFSYPMFRDLERAQSGFSGIAAHVNFGANLAHSSQTSTGQGMLVSGSYFPVLGLRSALGRLLDPGDDETVGENFVTVLSYDYWANRLGSDPGILNQSIIINGHSMTIVGVAPRGFDGTTLGAEPDVFVPISMRGLMNPGFTGFENRRSYWAYLFARLKPGVTIERAGTEINATYSAILDEVEAPLQEGMSAPTLERFRAKQITLAPGARGQSQVHSEAGTPLILLLVITGVVLLIACANIANLLLARGAARGQEMAIRGSLGAGRRHLLVQLLTESLLLAMLGGVASLFVAQATLGLIGTFLPPEAANMLVLELSPTVLVFTAAVSLGTGLLFGLYPALHSTRPDLVTMLKANTGQPSGGRAAARFRSALVTAQLALSMALLASAGLFIKSLVNVSKVDLGLSTENLITFAVSPELNGYEAERSLAFFERTEEELAAIPGVTGVSAALVPVLAGSSWGSSVRVEGFESGPDIDADSRYNEIGPNYFSTLGMPLLGGREFTLSDGAGAPKVAIVNEAFTRKFGLDTRNAVGRFMGSGRGDELDTEIVGVVQDAKYSDVKQEVPPVFFRPYRQDDVLGSINFYVRASLEPSQILAAITPLMGRLDPNLPVEGLKTLDQQVKENVFLDRFISTLSAAFAVLATLLATVGLYGVLAYTVTQRTREIGLRMALGAGGAQVKGMVLKQVGRMTLIGGALGMVAAFFLGRAAESLLFGLEGSDPFVFVAVAVLLVGVAMGAGYVPAHRASKIDPMEALRYE